MLLLVHLRSRPGLRTGYGVSKQGACESGCVGKGQGGRVAYTGPAASDAIPREFDHAVDSFAVVCEA